MVNQIAIRVEPSFGGADCTTPPMHADELLDPAALRRLALSRDAATRDKLALALAATTARHDLREHTAGPLVESLLTELVISAARDLRQRVAGMLADCDWAPRDLVARLAHDEIDVARLVLAASQALRDADLVSAANQGSEGHRLAIAGRRTLSECVAAAIAARREPDVLAALLANAGAQLDGRTLKTCIDTARLHPRLRQPLTTRPELAGLLVGQLYLIVGEDLRARLTERFPEQACALADLVASARAEALGAPRPHAERDAAAAAHVDTLVNETALTARVALAAASQSEAELLDHALARLAGVRAPALRAAIATSGVWAAAIACRAAGLSRADFALVHKAMAASLRLPSILTQGEFRAVANAFDSLTPETAADTLAAIAL